MKQIPSHFQSFVVVTSLILLMPKSQAGSVLVSVSGAGQSTSAVENTNVYDFNQLPTGYHYDVSWDGVGSFDQLFISNANLAGGAIDPNTGSGSRFPWVGYLWADSSTLTLTSPSSYFGLWWSAGDGTNLLTFYSGTDVVAQYSTASLFNSLALNSDYYGHPERGRNTSEPYAFINFFGDETTKWDSIEVTTTHAGGGFESDNFTTRIEAFNPLEENVADIGPVVAELEGTETTLVDNTTTTWVWAQQNTPGAPTPPIFALLLFAAVIAAKEKFM